MASRIVLFVILTAGLGGSLSATSAAKCANVSFGDLCGTQFRARIAGIELGVTQTQVARALGQPLASRRGRAGGGNCPFADAAENKLTPTVESYSDHLTVKLERYSHSNDICLKRQRNLEQTVFDIKTTSSKDKFSNGIHVGSTVAAARSAFKRQHIRCTVVSHGKFAGNGSCALNVRIPPWAAGDNAMFAGLLLAIKHDTVITVELRLQKAYS